MSQFGGLGLAGLGMGMGAIGSALGGSSANRAGREARDWYDSRNRMQGANLLGILYGQDRVNMAWPDAPGIQGQGYRDYIESLGGPVLDQLKGLGTTFGQRGQSLLGDYDAGTRGVQQRGQSLVNSYMNRSQGAQGDVLQAMNRGTLGLDQMAARSEGTAGLYGRDRANQIRQDSATSLRAANQQSKAALNAAGFGNSTAMANQYAGNASANERNTQRLLQDAADATTDRTLAAQSQRLGLNAGRQGATDAARLGMTQQRLGTFAQLGTDQNNRMAQRSADRSGLQERNLGRDLGLAQQPINTILGMQQSPLLNWWSGTNASQYYPGQSGVGNALGGIGGGLAGLGGQMYGNYLQNQNMQQMLQMLG